jgi:glutathione synthase/RimK-type ligase-like ATP-grasp enzyme
VINRPNSNASTPVVALVTYAVLPELTTDDRWLLDALDSRGVRAVPTIWDDARVDWTAFSAVVIRSCWDYYLRHADFLAWVAQLEAAAVPLWNPAHVLRWNAEKTYLCELARRGVSVIPTRLVEPGEDVSLASVLDSQGWERAVVKPAISAAAHDTWLTSRASAATDDPRFRRMLATGRVLVQPFIDAVRDDGELSILFFGGEYSHAVRKLPGTGDFRVQVEHGGTAVACEPAADIIAQARAVLSAGLPGMAECLYARVDGCVVDGRFMLMELELIEPALFLSAHPAAPDRLASALLRRLS